MLPFTSVSNWQWNIFWGWDRSCLTPPLPVTCSQCLIPGVAYSPKWSFHCSLPSPAIVSLPNNSKIPNTLGLALWWTVKKCRESRGPSVLRSSIMDVLTWPSHFVRCSNLTVFWYAEVAYLQYFIITPQRSPPQTVLGLAVLPVQIPSDKTWVSKVWNKSIGILKFIFHFLLHL